MGQRLAGVGDGSHVVIIGAGLFIAALVLLVQWVVGSGVAG